MHRKCVAFIAIVSIFALTLSAPAQDDLPVLSPDESGAPADSGAPDSGEQPAKKKDSAKGGAVAAMTAEQGEDLEKKIDKLLDEQKKVIEKLDQLQKDLDFVKVSVRVR
jgi:hypothetical protein